MASVTFINAPEDREEFLKKAKRSLEHRAQDMQFYCLIGTEHKEDQQRALENIVQAIHTGEVYDLDDLSKIAEQAHELPDFHDYGLCFDYVELGTFEDQDEDYFRYQFSYGGPTEELRIYENGLVEFVYLDWFCGIGFRIDNDPEHEEWVEWMTDWFSEIGLMDFEAKREETNYYMKKEDMYDGEEESE